MATIWVVHSQAKTCGRAIVEDTDRISVEADNFGKAVDQVCDSVEATTAARRVGPAKAWQVGGHDMEGVGQKRDEFTEHKAGTGETMKQQHFFQRPTNPPPNRKSSSLRLLS